jgi:hypothetical protein
MSTPSTPNHLSVEQPLEIPESSFLPKTDTHDAVQHVLESPVLPEVNAWLQACGDLKLSAEATAKLYEQSGALLAKLKLNAADELLRDVVCFTRIFLIPLQGSEVTLQTQGEWRPTLDSLEQRGGWRAMLSHWNSGKLYAQLAGTLPSAVQIVFLRQSLESFMAAAEHGEQHLPMSMPVQGASIDLAHVQEPDEKGTALVSRLTPPSRYIAALGVTVADAEKRSGNNESAMRLLDEADAHRAAAMQQYAGNAFTCMNLTLNHLIADTVVRGEGNGEKVQKFLDDMHQEGLTLNAFKRLEWTAHAHGLLALITGEAAMVQTTMEDLRAIAQHRPEFMQTISIEPTFKECAERFPEIHSCLYSGKYPQ